MPLLLISEIVVILASVHLIGIALIVLVIIVSAGERTARRRKPSGTRRQTHRPRGVLGPRRRPGTLALPPADKPWRQTHGLG